MRSQTEETFVEDVMGKQRQSWTVEEKLGIVLAVLSERQSVAEVARQHGVNENQIYRWKEQFLAAGRQGLNGGKAQTADQRLDAENSPLKKLLGEKALEMEILKKIPGFEEAHPGGALSSLSHAHLLKNTRFCMCVQIQQADGQLRSRPLTTQNQSLDEGVLYFFIPKDGDIAQNLQYDRRINLAYANVDKNSYVSISGEGQIRDDAAKKQELFNSFAKAWFPGGPTDPNLGLLAVQLQDAEYWDTKESKMMQLFKIMKANLTGTTPDLGEHGQVSSAGR